MKDWGRILVSTRLEKQISPRFFQAWSLLIRNGLRPGDGFYSVGGMVAHKAQNDVVRHFLQTECDTLLTLDSDADVAQEFVEQFRSYEPGFAYDILQAFYPRRGWPPRAIWMKRNAVGEMTEHIVIDPDLIEDVDVCGTHACLFRREVFERLLGDADPATYEWFYYPRHKPDSEDAAFSHDAKAAGFRLGATSAIRAGHITEVVTTWDTYQDYLHVTGSMAGAQRFDELSRMVADFTGEPVETVVAKAAMGGENVKRAWQEAIELAPDGAGIEVIPTAEAERAFYGSANNGYLYDLIGWNSTPLYERILAPLRGVSGQKVLVIGTGLGTEADVMADANPVTCFELPGVLRDFAMERLGNRVAWMNGDTLRGAIEHCRHNYYDLIVAIDTLEHVHPYEISDVLGAISWALAPNGHLYAHNNWGDQELYPMHRDYGDAFDAWCERVGLVQEGEFLWRRS